MTSGRILSAGRSFASLGVVLGLMGCAIHPVPEDVTGATTYQIARQIRCETRAAAKAHVIGFLRQFGNDSPYAAGDLRAKQLLALYDEGGSQDISTFRPGLFAGPYYEEVRNYLTMIYTTAVAYSFDLTGDVQNNIGTTVNLVGPWANNFTLGISADANRERQNERVFTLTDTLGDLLMSLSKPQYGVPYCGAEQLVGPNYLYPAAGNIGVYETLKTFFELNSFTNVTATDGSKAGNVAATAPTFTDKLTFTTTVDFSGSPKVTFAPVGSRFQFADAMVKGSVQRTDTHKVYVALALEPAGVVSSAALHNFQFASPVLVTAGGKRIAKSKTVVGTTVTAQIRTRGQEIAVSAVDQLQSREVQFILSR
ncbi:hypothetical protein ABIB82_006114 [Bradyrhizobium sp. i1.8.4]|uniref:hypothetical protein n=1 Tax=unclassified Bradyrhizobium TaxID=2631580 RepID=UPI003D253D6D